MKKALQNNECEHDHFFTQSWGGSDLTESMLEREQKDGCEQVHHVKMYAWTEEWKNKHKL